MKILVAADGECSLIKHELYDRIGTPDKVIVADGALRHIDALGLTPNYIVGDLDSVDKDLLEKYQSAKIEKYPRDKDKTDLEIALEKALTFSPTELIFIGMFGGRIDHQFGNILLLTKLTNQLVKVEDSNFSCFLLNGHHKITLQDGNGFSLIPLTEKVTGVSVKRARWELDNSTLSLGAPTALCNEFLDDEVEISTSSGSLLIVVYKTKPLPITL